MWTLNPTFKLKSAKKPIDTNKKLFNQQIYFCVMHSNNKNGHTRSGGKDDDENVKKQRRKGTRKSRVGGHIKQQFYDSLKSTNK